MEYYSLAEAAKATGRDKRTIKHHREQGKLTGEPVMEDGRLTGWQFDPAELARAYPEFHLLEASGVDKSALSPTKGDNVPGQEGAAGGTSQDIIVSYQARVSELTEAKTRLEGDNTRLASELEHARCETREERDKAGKERERLHGIIESHTRLLTYEREQVDRLARPSSAIPWRQYGISAVVMILLFMASMVVFAALR